MAATKTEGASSPSQKPLPRPLMPRFVTFVAIVLALKFWLSRHLSTELDTVSSIIAAVLSVGGGILCLLDKPAGNKITGALKKPATKLLCFGLQTSVLVGAVAVVVILGSLFSSVTVLRPGGGPPLAAVLRPVPGPPVAEGAKEETALLEGPDAVVRFFRFVNPFGSSYVLEVQGFLSHSLLLFPWVGKTIRTDQDLRRTPDVIVRIPFTKMCDRLGGTFTVQKNGATVEGVDSLRADEDHGSLLLGGRLSLNPGAIGQLLAAWRLEMDRKDIKETLRAEFLYAWAHPLPVSAAGALSPGDTIAVSFFADPGDRKPLAQTEFEVSAETLQDVVLAGTKE